MSVQAVITGDVVDSTLIKPTWRSLLLPSIHEVADELKELSSLTIEFFRGDSFQIVIDKPEEAVKIAILLRAGLKSKTPQDSEQPWDVRLAVGIGTIDYLSEKIVVSDGEAFRYSGRMLDEIGKRRLVVLTRWDEVNEELNISTAFADDIVSGWSISQAQVAYLSLLQRVSQKEIATNLNKSVQSISKLLSAAKENLIRMYLERYTRLITKYVTSKVL
jgi:hypothetical protein